jgi:hypothetical protein
MSSFTFVRIPADESEPVEELTASKDGGLEQDELVKYAKEYFRKQSSTNDFPSCDIMALSIPLVTNGYQAVSLYSNNYGTVQLEENKRATALVIACGHSLPQPVMGDIFVGRAHDDESKEWERLNFNALEADAKANWCRQARSSGGGGGQGGKSATAVSSLSNMMQQQLSAATGQGKAPPQIIGGGTNGMSETRNNMFGMDGASAVMEEWGSWTQSSDEVELKLPVNADIKAKDCQVIFKRQSLKVSVRNVVQLEGTLFGSVVPDDCTYTIESGVLQDGDNGRELCITVTKAEEGMTWSWVTTS